MIQYYRSATPIHTAFAGLIVLVSLSLQASAASFNAYGLDLYTVESAHFRIHYQEGLEEVAKDIGGILEDLYDTYRNEYQLTLPNKTEALVTDDDQGGGWALAILNMIHIWANDMEWPYRGTRDHLRNVVAHEYAHIVSIWSSFKMPSWMPYIQYGYFSHPNAMIRGGKNDFGARLEAFHLFPSEILPPWFFEGIAQFESARNKGDAWDTHRDMILRTLTLSDKLLTWDHMSVFAGKEDDYEKTYNHGFSLVSYIADTYGDGAIPAMLREASEFGRLSFDGAVKEVLGISARQLYKDWKASLKKKYTRQVKGIGKQVFGKKINKYGYDNQLPRFGPDDSKIYFLSNNKHDYGYSFKSLFSYALSDTVDSAKKIAPEMPQVKGWYALHKQSKQIVFSSLKSKKSVLPPHKGGYRRKDLFIDSLPSGKKQGLFAKKTERQVTFTAGAYHADFSPDARKLAYSKHVKDKFYLCIADSSGEHARIVYPAARNDSAAITTIFSVDWSADGNRIAIGYVDNSDRKIGIYDTLTKEFFDLCDTDRDERNPRFSPSGNSIYFSSDRTGIFNIYRYHFENGALERLTNVAGGAFAPDVDKNESRLVYINYDAKGFGVYLLDSIRVLSADTLEPEVAVAHRTKPQRPQYKTSISSPSEYSRFPRQFLFVPTVFAEQTLSENDDAFTGITDFKLGGVFSWNDPFDWAAMGTNFGGYALFEPSTLHNLFSLRPQKVTYDAGAFLTTRLLPFDLSLIYALRSIAAKDWFEHNDYGEKTIELLEYSMKPSILDITVTHDINRMLSLHALGGFNWYDVSVSLPHMQGGDSYYSYSPARGSRIGAYATFLAQAIDRRMDISPRGLSAKVKYEFWNQKLQNEFRSFESDSSGNFVENYDSYRYSQLTLGLKYGISAPWVKKHDLVFQLDGTAIQLTQRTKEELREQVAKDLLEHDDLPSYYKPGDWLPGYAYYYRVKDTTDQYIDTLLLSGNGVLTGGLSYRFPLVPQSIDTKLGFIYFDQLYMGLNAGAGTAKDNLDDFKNLAREDFLIYSGAELRLQAISFNTYPLAVGLRWDWGMDKPAPIGGHKFALQIGFNFEDWGLIVEPDGALQSPRNAALHLR